MTPTTVYYACNNEKQPIRFQLVIGSCSYELPKIEIYEILECVASAYGYQKEPFIEEQTECFVKGNRCIHVSQQATTLTFVVNDLRLVMEKQCRNHEEVFREVNHILLNIFEETPCVFLEK